MYSTIAVNAAFLPTTDVLQILEVTLTFIGAILTAGLCELPFALGAEIHSRIIYYTTGVLVTSFICKGSLKSHADLLVRF